MLERIVASSYADLRERGIECEGVADLAWGRFITFADPDANR